MENSDDNKMSAVRHLKLKEETRPDSCETHGGFESKGRSIFDRPMVWSGCPVCAEIARKEKEEAEAVAAQIEAQRKLEKQFRRAGVPLRYMGKGFADFVADTDSKERAKAVSMEFAQSFTEHYKKGTVLVFSGKVGTGKSHLALAIAQQVMPRYTAMYTSAIDAIRMVRATWRRDSEQSEIQVIDTLSGVDLLILDEIGVQHGTESEQVTLFDIIDKRYRDMMPTILLTNQNKEGMRAFLGDRSFDRLREGGMWVSFDWESGRGSK